jgi:hypothetical protein
MLFVLCSHHISQKPAKPIARHHNDRPANLRCLKIKLRRTARLAGRAARENTWQVLGARHVSHLACNSSGKYWLGLVTVAVVRHALVSRVQTQASVPILRSLAWSFAGSEHSRTGPLTHMTTAARNLANLLPNLPQITSTPFLRPERERPL